MKSLFTIQVNPYAPAWCRRMVYRALMSINLVDWYHPTQKEFVQGAPLCFHDTQPLARLADLLERRFTG